MMMLIIARGSEVETLSLRQDDDGDDNDEFHIRVIFAATYGSSPSPSPCGFSAVSPNAGFFFAAESLSLSAQLICGSSFARELS